MDQVVEGTPLGESTSESFDSVGEGEDIDESLLVMTEALTQSFIMILVSEIGTFLLFVVPTLGGKSSCVTF